MRVKDVTELLAGRDLPMRRALDVAVTYQEPCHLAHAQRITQPPRLLLRSIPGLELREMAERSLCCGSAGIYNVTNTRESRALLQRRLDQALATGADVIATANPGCLLHLRAGLAQRGSRIQVRHVFEQFQRRGSLTGNHVGVVEWGISVAPVSATSFAAASSRAARFGSQNVILPP